MDNEGNVELTFNDKMNLDYFYELQNMNFTEMRKKLVMAIIPADEQDPIMVEIRNYSIVEITETVIKINIVFVNPRYLSIRKA